MENKNTKSPVNSLEHFLVKIFEKEFLFIIGVEHGN
jgi:hypothetical protein